MIHPSQYQPRCIACGQFCKVADSGTPWGCSTDLEPPDEEFYCTVCAKNELDEILERNDWIKCWWLKPNFIQVARSIFRHRRKLNGEAVAS